MIIDRTRRRKIYPLLRAEPVTINGSQQTYTTISSGSVDFTQRNYLDFGSAFNVADNNFTLKTEVNLKSIITPNNFSIVNVDQFGRVISGSLISTSPGTYSNVIVDQFGRVTGGTSGSINNISGTYSVITINASGSITSGSLVSSLPGTYNKITIDQYGRVLSGISSSFNNISGTYSVIDINASGDIISGSLISTTPGIYNNVNVDQYGRVLGGVSGSINSISGTYSVININSLGAIDSGSLISALPGTYNKVSVDQYGRVLGGTSGSINNISGTYSVINISSGGSITSGSLITALPGTYNKVNIDQYGRVLNGTTGSLSLANTYTTVTVNQYGQVTSGSTNNNILIFDKPNISIVDDFTGPASLFDYNWQSAGSGAGTAAAINVPVSASLASPGWCSITKGSSATGRSWLYYGASNLNGSILIGTTYSQVVEWIFAVPTLSAGAQTFICELGYTNSASASGTSGNGIMFRINTNNTVTCAVVSAGVDDVATTLTTATTILGNTVYRARIIHDKTTCRFYIGTSRNGSLTLIHSFLMSALPVTFNTTPIGIFAKIRAVNGNNAAIIALDRVIYEQE